MIKKEPRKVMRRIKNVIGGKTREAKHEKNRMEVNQGIVRRGGGGIVRWEEKK